MVITPPSLIYLPLADVHTILGEPEIVASPQDDVYIILMSWFIPKAAQEQSFINYDSMLICFPT